MEVVLSKPADLPAMIDLLKLSLGETLMPKSEAFFTWKHFENPFGASKVLLAKEGDEIIGLRAFMHWEWAKDNQYRRAVRAVDTATNPSHQGRGIFKKLTMQAVEECKAEGVHFVFNSPNVASRQGYLKMGWVDAGKMPIFFKPGVLFPKSYNKHLGEDIANAFPLEKACEKWAGKKLPVTFDAWSTPLSVEFLKWRYNDCPLIKYGAFAGDGDLGIVFRIKQIKSFRELRICEIWANNPMARKSLKQGLKNIVHYTRPAVVSCAPNALTKEGFGFFGPFKKGPLTTVRELILADLSDYIQFNNWQPSIGAMEVF